MPLRYTLLPIVPNLEFTSLTTSLLASLCATGGFEERGQLGDVVGTQDQVHVGRLLEERLALLLGDAAGDHSGDEREGDADLTAQGDDETRRNERAERALKEELDATGEKEGHHDTSCATKARSASLGRRRPASPECGHRPWPGAGGLLCWPGA